MGDGTEKCCTKPVEEAPVKKEVKKYKTSACRCDPCLCCRCDDCSCDPCTCCQCNGTEKCCTKPVEEAPVKKEVKKIKTSACRCDPCLCCRCGDDCQCSPCTCCQCDGTDKCCTKPVEEVPVKKEVKKIKT